MSSTCYHCSATVTPSLRACIACGAELTEEARLAFAQRARASRVAELRNVLLLAGVVVAFALGSSLSSWAGGKEADAGDTVSVAATDTVPRAVVIDYFAWTIQGPTKLRIQRWEAGAEGATIFELATPSAGDVHTLLWESMNDQERAKLFGWISVAYTHMLREAGYRLEGPGEHPIVVLRYAGLRQPLAVRHATGQVALYPSPFQRSTSVPAGGQ